MWSDGDDQARDDLFRSLYDDLKALARRERSRLTGDATLDTTALLHELYLKLARGKPVTANDRVHFLCIATKALRQVLVDHARARRRLKRQRELLKMPAQPSEEIGIRIDAQADDVLRIHNAVEKLGLVANRQAEVVELRFFGGLSYDEIARAMGVTKKTVYRDWVKAKAWLRKELR